MALERAEEDHRQGLEAIRKQHEIHMADTLERKKACQAKLDQLELELTECKRNLADMMAKTSSEEAAAPVPAQVLGAPSLHEPLKSALTGISAEQVELVKGIFNSVSAAQARHVRPPPGKGIGEQGQAGVLGKEETNDDPDIQMLQPGDGSNKRCKTDTGP